MTKLLLSVRLCYVFPVRTATVSVRATTTENYGGSEANVSVSLATLGDNVEYITRVPDNPIGRNACLRLNEYNVSTDHVVRGGDRLGLTISLRKRQP